MKLILYLFIALFTFCISARAATTMASTVRKGKTATGISVFHVVGYDSATDTYSVQGSVNCAGGYILNDQAPRAAVYWRNIQIWKAQGAATSAAGAWSSANNPYVFTGVAPGTHTITPQVMFGTVSQGYQETVNMPAITLVLVSGGSSFDPDGDRQLTLNYTNNTGVGQWVGATNGNGYYFGLQYIPPGGTYQKSFNVPAGDTSNYSLGLIDLEGYSYSGENPAGRGYLQFHDGDANGVTGEDSDIIRIPSGFVGSTGVSGNWSTSTSKPTALDWKPSESNVVSGSSSGTSGTPVTGAITGTTTGGKTISGVTGTGGGLTEGTGGAGLAEVNANLRGIKDAIIAQGPNGGTGGGNTTVNVDFSGVHSRLDTANERLQVSNDKLTAIDDRMAAFDDDIDAIRDHVAQEGALNVPQKAQEALETGQEAADGLRNSDGITSIFGVANTSVNTGGGSSAVSLPVQLSGPVLVGGFGPLIDLSPTQAGGAQSSLGQDWSWFLSWVKHFIAATAVIWFCKEAVDSARQACFALGATPQHRLGGTTDIVLSSQVAGCSIGAVPASLMWGFSVIAVTAVLVAAPTLLAASVYAFANVSGVISSFSGSVGSLAQAAGSGAPGLFAKVFGLVNAVCPVGLLLVISLNRILLSISAFVQFVAFNVGIKLVGMI